MYTCTCTCSYTHAYLKCDAHSKGRTLPITQLETGSDRYATQEGLGIAIAHSMTTLIDINPPSVWIEMC